MIHQRRQSPFFVLFILLSLLLHLIVLYLVPEQALRPEVEQPPVVVEMRPPPQQLPRPMDRELDLPEPSQQTQERTRPAKRLSEFDQQVDKETAPKGEDPEDRMASVQARPQKPQQQQQPTPPTPKPKSETKPTQPHADDLVRVPGMGPATSQTPSEQEKNQEASQSQEKPVDIAKLLELPDATVERMASEMRRKYRKDVEEGDAVWLDTEKDLLISFFKRFRDHVYMNWNYPAIAAESGQRGTCLLKITFKRDGTVADVEVKETTGFPLLDKEAVDAVQKGSGSYGPLHSAYKGETLIVFAFFQYNLTTTKIFGQQ